MKCTKYGAPQAPGRKKLWPVLGILAAAAAVTAVVVMLVFPLRPASPESTDEAAAPSAAAIVPAESTAPAETLPEGTTLIEGAWENGDVTVIAMDEKNLWIRITDDRPEQEFGELGASWKIEFFFGEEMTVHNSEGSLAANYPYRISLLSLAEREMRLQTHEAGKKPGFDPERLKNLFITQWEKDGDAFVIVNNSTVDMLDIARNGAVYTARLTLPDWFDASLCSELTSVQVLLSDRDFYEQYNENGRASYSGSYMFRP